MAVNATVISFLKGQFGTLSEQLLGYLAGQHCQEMSNSDVRCFTSAIKFFLPWTPRERITSELRGIEKELAAVYDATATCVWAQVMVGVDP